MWKEQHLYGSSRLGIFAPEVKIQGVYVLDVAALKQSVRSYELTNHLGNVLSTITDKGVITSAQDYFPFGLTLASRSFTEGGSVYRYSFNGKEDDKGLKQQDYGMRISRPDLGRFLSVDPIGRKYPELTPYQFASNRPIDGIDLDGLEYLGSEESRVEVVWGELLIKVENFHNINKNKFKAANEDPNNWAKGEIGVSRVIAKVSYKGLELVSNANTLSDPGHQKNQVKDIPGENLPANVNEQAKGVYKRNQLMPMTREETAKGMKPATGKGMSLASAALDVVDYGAAQLAQYHYNDDKDKVEEHMRLAASSLDDMNRAIKEGLIPSKFMNKKDLSDIANVILQGNSVHKNNEIQTLGIEIHNKYHPKPLKMPSIEPSLRSPYQLFPKQN